MQTATVDTTVTMTPKRKLVITNLIIEALILGAVKIMLSTIRLSIASLKPESSLGINESSGSYRLNLFWLFMLQLLSFEDW